MVILLPAFTGSTLYNIQSSLEKAEKKQQPNNVLHNA